MDLQKRLFLTLGIVLLLAFGGHEVLNYQKIRGESVQQFKNLAEQTRGVLMATRRVYHHQFLESGIALTPKTLGFLPAYSLSRISKDFPNWSSYGMTFNNVSDRPRNPDNKADAVELEAIRHFRQHPDQTLRFIEFESPNGDPYFHYARPIWVEEYCLKCHGDRNVAPEAISGSYDTAFDYRIGELRGILSIKVPAANLDKNILSRFQRDAFIHLITFLLTFLILSFFIRRYMVRPLSRLRDGMESIIAGDFGQELKGLEGDFATIGHAFNDMAETLTKYAAARDQAEVHQKLSKERLKLALEGSNVGLWDWDIQSGKVYFSPLWESLLGFTPNEMRGDIRAWKKLLHPDDRDRVTQLLEEHLEGKSEFYQSEHRLKTKSGQWLWVHDRGKVLERDSDGAPLRAVGTQVDITQCRQTEGEIKRLKQELEFILGATKTGLDIIDPDFNLRYVDPEWEKIYGPFTNRKCYSYFADRETPCPGCGIPKALETKATIVSEEVLPKENNRPIQVTTIPFQNREGEWLVAEVNVDISERKRFELELKQLAISDGLTGIFNRRHFFEIAKKELSRHYRYDHTLAILMLDIDHFKKINDAYGHAIGDEVLRKLTSVCGEVLRENDLMARFGGEEFVFLLPESRLPAAEKVARRLLHALAKASVEGPSGPVQITVSIGVVCSSGDQETLEQLLLQADKAMYEAKSEGRNQVVVHNL